MKTCPFCAEEIQDAAIVCKHCGRELSTGQSNRVIAQTAQPNNGIAAVLSLVIPGAGQMYKGQVGQGLIWLVVVVLGYVMFIIPGLILHLVCILSAATSRPPVSGTRSTTQAHPTQVLARTIEDRVNAARGFRRFVLIIGSLVAISALSLLIGYYNSRSHAPAVSSSEPTSDTVPDTLPDTLSPLGNPAHDAVIRLPVPARAEAFGKVLAGHPFLLCDKVTRTFFAGQQGSTHDAAWSVGCADGQTYQVTLKADKGGSTSVLSCATLKDVAKVECFKPLTGQ
jgi:TM2 domain-containing membrane protein YozV